MKSTSATENTAVHTLVKWNQMYDVVNVSMYVVNYMYMYNM